MAVQRVTEADAEMTVRIQRIYEYILCTTVRRGSTDRHKGEVNGLVYLTVASVESR